jgi:DNA repair exonuclease SbcCD ATPase subunit
MVKKQSELQTKLNSTLLLKKEEDRIRQEINTIRLDVSSLNSCTCPTCTQQWVGEGQKKKIEEKMSEAKTKASRLKEILSELSTIEEQKTTIEKLSLVVSNLKNQDETALLEKICSLDKETKEIQKDLDRQSSSYSEKQQELWTSYNAAVAKLKKDFDTSVKDLNLEISNSEMEVKENALKKKNYDDQVRFFEAQVQNLNNQEASLLNQISSIDEQFKSLTRKKDVYLEAARCIKSYLFSVFQDSLDYIGNRATTMLSKVPNTSNCVIYFETGKENKDGTIKEEITPYINLEGDVNVPVATLCGGERAAIDLAVDLAVNDLIECRRGGGFDWIVLDEPFNGLDTIGKEACLELLSGEEINRRIIVVDHGSELKEMVSDKILVERNGEESIISGG